MLVGLSYFSLDVVLAQDGSLVSSQESDSLTDSGSLADNKWVSAVGDTLYLATITIRAEILCSFSEGAERKGGRECITK